MLTTKLRIVSLAYPVLDHAEECRELVCRICVHCAPKPATALSMLRSASAPSGTGSSPRPCRFLPTSVGELDARLRGGILKGSITELVGRPGTAKSQLAMQLCVVAARYGQASVYVDTEAKLSRPRFREIASNRRRQQQQHGTSRSLGDDNHHPMYTQQQYQQTSTPIAPISTEFHSCDESATGPMSEQQLHQNYCASNNGDREYKSEQVVFDNVILRSPTSTEELLASLKDVEDEILLRNDEAAADAAAGASPTKFPVGLLVLDSIAAPVRRDFGSGTAARRAAAVLRCAQILKRLADQLDLCVVVINQIGNSSSGSGDSSRNHGDFAFGNDSATQHQAIASSTAALGTSWHHCISTRIMLECETLTTPNEQKYHRRQARIVKSNLVGQGPPIPFGVKDVGLVDEVSK